MDFLSNVSGASANRTRDPPPGYDRYRIVVDVYLAGSLCVVGFVGNALSMAVVRTDRDPNRPTNWLLQSLAVVDSLYLVTCLFLQPLKTATDLTRWVPAGVAAVLPFVEPHVWGVASTAQTMTVWVVLLVTCDRYLAVCMATRFHLRSLRRAKIAVAAVVVAAVVYNGPRFFERRVDLVHDPTTNVTTARTSQTALRRDRVYFLVYKTILYFIFRSAGPLAALTLLNLRLVGAMRRRLGQQRRSEASVRRGESVTTMLVVVVAVFVVCEVPDLCLRLAVTVQEFVPGVRMDVWKLRYVNAVTNLLLTVNSSVNFVIYCLVGRKFRQIFLRMIGCNGRTTTAKDGTTNTETLNTAVATKIVLNDVSLQKCLRGKQAFL